MNSIAQIFARCQTKNRKALMPFLTAGFPDRKTFLRLLKEFDDNGADLIEIGIPFSDPLADGPVIQQASQHALESGVTVRSTLELLRNTNGASSAPRIIMSYYNPIRAFGLERFAEQARRAGVVGLIVPDIIWEEGPEIERICRSNHIDLIYLLARTSPATRRQQILKKSKGFVYLVSVNGVTGADATFPPRVLAWIKQVKQESSLPVCVGFGISNAGQARAVARHADGVIIGSAIIELIRKTGDSRKAVRRVGEYLRGIRKGIHHG